MSEELAARADVPSHVADMIARFPSTMHPMTQFVSAIAALQTESVFAKGYSSKSISKHDYWKAYYEDSMNLIAKLPVVAASIYRNTYGDGNVACIDPKLDCVLYCSLYIRGLMISSFVVVVVVVAYLVLTQLINLIQTFLSCSLKDLFQTFVLPLYLFFLTSVWIN